MPTSNELRVALAAQEKLEKLDIVANGQTKTVRVYLGIGGREEDVFAGAFHQGDPGFSQIMDAINAKVMADRDTLSASVDAAVSAIANPVAAKVAAKP